MPDLDLSQSDALSRTVLHYAVLQVPHHQTPLGECRLPAQDAASLVERLVRDPRLQAGTLARREEERGHTPLMLAAWIGRPQLVNSWGKKVH